MGWGVYLHRVVPNRTDTCPFLSWAVEGQCPPNRHSPGQTNVGMLG